MSPVLSASPLLWYLNRGTGTVLEVLLSAAVVMGLLATVGRAGRGLPRWLVQGFHRNLSLLAVLLLAVHVVTAVTDTFVDIRWWQALLPWGGTYRPFWLALGAIALDLMVAITLTSLVRSRLRHRAWRAVHLTAYAAWGVALWHGVGIGTDANAPWARWVLGGCVAAVVVAGAWRLVLLVPARAHGSASRASRASRSSRAAGRAA